MKVAIIGSRMYENTRKIKEALFQLKQKFGEDLIIKKLEKPKGFLAKKLSTSIDNHVDNIANVLEERAQWQKFGL